MAVFPRRCRRRGAVSVRSSLSVSWVSTIAVRVPRTASEVSGGPINVRILMNGEYSRDHRHEPRTVEQFSGLDESTAGCSPLRRRDGTATGCGPSNLCVDDDWEYRQALIEEGVDPDDPRIRRALAEVAACLGPDR